MKKLLLATVAGMALVAAGSANAADLGLRPAYKAPAPVIAPVPWSWTGFYIGAHIGSAWASEDWAENLPGDPFNGKSIANGTLNGFLGGFQAGANYQIDRIVLGLQGDFSWSGVSGKPGGIFCEEELICNSKKEWFATFTARIGGTIDHALLYVKGGVAWVHDKHDFGVIDCSGCSFTLGDEGTRTGWTWGAGIEYAFTPHWTGFIEYDFMDFGTRTVGATECDPEGCEFTSSFADITQRVHMVKAGVNYKFDWWGFGKGKAPVVAKY
jgi:outer membrane immunogenic protein